MGKLTCTLKHSIPSTNTRSLAHTQPSEFCSRYVSLESRKGMCTDLVHTRVVKYARSSQWLQCDPCSERANFCCRAEITLPRAAKDLLIACVCSEYMNDTTVYSRAPEPLSWPPPVPTNNACIDILSFIAHSHVTRTHSTP